MYKNPHNQENSEQKISERNFLPKTSNGVNKKLFFLVLAAIVIFGLVFFFRSGGLGSRFVWAASNGGTLLLPLVIIASLIDSINPCAFSVLLLTIALLFSLGKLRSDILKIGGMYIFGIFLIYILIGLGILQALHLFNTPHFMAKVGAGLLIAFGLVNIINEFFPSFPIKLKIPSAAHHTMAKIMQHASMPAAFVLGAFVGLCEFPCTGGPYLAVLGLLHDSQTYLRGFLYLVLYNAVFVLPLAVILGIASNKAVLEKVKTWQQSEKGNERLYGGIAMVVLGVFMYLI